MVWLVQNCRSNKCLQFLKSPELHVMRIVQLMTDRSRYFNPSKNYWFSFNAFLISLIGLYFRCLSFRVVLVNTALFFLSRRAQIFFPEFNIRLCDKNSESDYFFFPPIKSEYIFQQHWESEYFFRTFILVKCT
jgi:hypothetical protein